MENEASLADTLIAAYSVHTVLSDVVATVGVITETFIYIYMHAAE